LAEIWHTCSLGKYLGLFFSFFQNFHYFHFGALLTILGQNWAKTFRAAYRAKKWLDLAECHE